MHQTWALSQTANKSSGACSVCFAVRQLHIKDGTVHRHGPRKNPCAGSDEAPIETASLPGSIVHQTSSQAQSSGSSTTGMILNLPPSGSVPANSASSLEVGNTATPVHPSVKIPIIKHIPRSARPACGGLLTSIIKDILNKPSEVENWNRLVSFSSAILFKPARGGKRYNLTNAIKKRTCNFSDQWDIDNGCPAWQDSNSHRRRSDESKLADAVSAKIEDGNLRAAIRILCSDDTPAVESMENLEKLITKHPSAPDDTRSASPLLSNPLQMSSAEVLYSLKAFPAGSAGGPDGLRPQHLLDMVNCKSTGSETLEALTNLRI